MPATSLIKLALSCTVHLLLFAACKKPDSISTERASLTTQEESAGQAPTAASALRAVPTQPQGIRQVENSGFPVVVDTVLEIKCRRCHTDPPQNGAPFHLLTWEQSQKARQPGYNMPIWKVLGNAVRTGFMPDRRVTLVPPVEPLTEAEKKTLLDWVEAGAPHASSGWPR